MKLTSKDVRKLPIANESEVVAFLKEQDINLYCKKATIAKARLQFSEKTKTRAPSKRFSELTKEHCQWFKVKRRRPIRRDNLLTSDQWDHVKSVVVRNLHLLQGRPVAEAVEIVRSEVPCSPSVLNGLVNRLHVWDLA